jgi:hypothetical protein
VAELDDASVPDDHVRVVHCATTIEHAHVADDERVALERRFAAGGVRVYRCAGRRSQRQQHHG